MLWIKNFQKFSLNTNKYNWKPFVFIKKFHFLKEWKQNVKININIFSFQNEKIILKKNYSSNYNFF